MISLFKKSNKYKYINPSKRYPDGEVEVDKWLVSDFVLEKLVPIVGVHPFPLDELMLMTTTVCWYSPDYIFEWGTHVGKAARIFYEIKNTFKFNYIIYSIDLPDSVKHIEHPGNNRGLFVRGIKDVNLILGDGLDESMKLIKKIGKRKKILYFLDGDHSITSVRRELATISKNQPSATVLVHDTFYQVKKSGYNIGPHKSVQELLMKNKTYKLTNAELGLPGMSLLIPK